MSTATRLSKGFGIAVTVAALAAQPADAGDRGGASRDTAQSATVAAKSMARTAHVGPSLRGSSEGETLTVAYRARARHVGGHVSIGYRHDRSYHRPNSYGWPTYGYYGHYGHYAGWPYYRYPYPVVVYGSETSERPGAVETDVRPGRAEILVDGELAGQARDFNGTWDILWLSSGRHELEFRRDGYQTLKIRLDVDQGSYYRIRQRLNKGSGLDPRSLELTEDPESASPRAPDRPRYQAGGSSPDAPPPGDRQPALARGFLTIEAQPNDAAVYLDGKFLANAGELAALHGALPLAEGEHIVEVVRPGYRSVTKRITVRADKPATVKIRLQRNGV